MGLQVGELYASLNLDTSDYDKGLSRAKRGAKMLGKAAVAAGAAAGTAIAGVGAAATKVGKQWEQAMVGVEKVTSAETAKALEGELLNMADTMPVAHEKLAGFAETAGRLGIEGADNIRSFTRVIAELETATDLVGEEGATQMAKIMSMTDLGKTQFRELGAAVNKMSNNMATSASEIMNSTLRSASALDSLGLSGQEIASLNATMNTLAPTSRLAGSALRVLAEKMLKPRIVKEVGKALGMNAEKLKEMREGSPVEMIRLLVETLGEGGKAAGKLREALGATGTDLSKLSGNMNVLSEAMDMTKEQFEDATSLSDEYQTAIDTLQGQMDILKNQFVTTGIMIYKEFKPELKALVQWVMDNKTAIRNFAVGSIRNIMAFGETVYNVFNQVRGFFGDLTDAFDEGGVRGSIDEFADKLEGLQNKVPEGGAIEWSLKLTEDMARWVVENWDTITKIGKKIGEWTSKAINWGIDLVEDIAQWVKDNWDTIETIASSIASWTSKAISWSIGVADDIDQWIKDNWDSIEKWAGKITGWASKAINWTIGAYDEVAKWIKNNWPKIEKWAGKIEGWTSTAIKWTIGAVDNIADWIKKNWSTIETIAVSIGEWASKTVQWTINFVDDIASYVKKNWPEVEKWAGKIGEWTSKSIEWSLDFASDLKDWGSDKLNNVIEFFWSEDQSKADKTLEASLDFINKIGEGLTDKTQDVIDWFWPEQETREQSKNFQATLEFIDKVKDWFGDKVQAVKSFFWEQDYSDVELSGTLKFIADLGKWMADKVQSFRNWFWGTEVGDSEASGELNFDTNIKQSFLDNIWPKIKDMWPKLSKWTSETVKWSIDFIDEVGSDVRNNIWPQLKNIWKDIKGWSSKTIQWTVKIAVPEGIKKTRQAIESFVNVVTSSGPVGKTLRRIGKAVTILGSAMAVKVAGSAIWAAVSSLASALGGFLSLSASPLIAITAALTAGISIWEEFFGGLTPTIKGFARTLGVEVWKAIKKTTKALTSGEFEKIPGIWAKTFAKIKKEASNIWPEIRKGLGEGWGNLKGFMEKKAEELWTAFESNFPDIASVFSDQIPDISEQFDEVVKAGSDLVAKLKNKILPGLQTAWDKLTKVFARGEGEGMQTGRLEIFKKMIQDNLGTALEVVENVLETIEHLFKTGADLSTGNWKSALNNLKKAIVPQLDSVINIAKTFSNNIKGWLQIAGLWGEIEKGYETLTTNFQNKIIKPFTNMQSTMRNMGQKIVQGLIDGIKSMTGTFKQAWNNWVENNIPGMFRGLLKIKSPSKLMADLGKEIPRGIIEGIQSEKISMQNEISNMMLPPLNIATAPINQKANLESAGYGSRISKNQYNILPNVNDVTVDNEERVNQLASRLQRALERTQRNNGEPRRGG